MNTTERLKNIAIARQKEDEKERLAQQKKEDDIVSFFNYVSAYGEEIGDLIKVANELMKHEFPLGKKNNIYGTYEFISNGIDHNFGFVVSGSPRFDPFNLTIRGVGYRSGGVCGEVDFVANADGVIEFSEYFYRTRDGITGFARDFEKFKEKFYEYVDRL